MRGGRGGERHESTNCWKRSGREEEEERMWRMSFEEEDEVYAALLVGNRRMFEMMRNGS